MKAPEAKRLRELDTRPTGERPRMAFFDASNFLSGASVVMMSSVWRTEGRRVVIHTRTGITVVAVVLLVSASCGGDKNIAEPTGDGPSTTASGGTARGPTTVGVQVDGKTDLFNGAFNAYFPRQVTVHPGDSVQFSSLFRGEAHTVTLGQLVDAGVPKASPTDPTNEPPELKKIPRMLPRGPGDAVQVSAQPCFLPAGDPPAADACPTSQQQQPAFDATQTYYNSGFLEDGAVFKVKLADRLKPGTYHYFCNFHRTPMSGEIKVVATNEPAQSAADVTKAGRDELYQLATKLAPAANALKTGAMAGVVPVPAPGAALAGATDPSAPNALVTEFGPQDLSVAVDSAVTWTFLGPHTLSFNATEDLRIPFVKSPDGSVHINAKSNAPAGGPGAPQGPPPRTGGPPSSTPPPPTVVDGGSWDGNGFRSSGFVFSSAANLIAYKLAFSKPGTYPFICLIHPEMKGTIRVT